MSQAIWEFKRCRDLKKEGNSQIKLGAENRTQYHKEKGVSDNFLTHVFQFTVHWQEIFHYLFWNDYLAFTSYFLPNTKKTKLKKTKKLN